MPEPHPSTLAPEQKKPAPTSPALPACFPLPLRLERTAPFRATLLAPFVFRTALLERVEVEAGFDTDYASVPRPLWSLYPPDGDYTPAAVIHDALYWHQHTAEPTEENLGLGLARPVTRAEADLCFLQAMTALGIPALRRAILYRAVRLGGGRAWANNARHRAGLPPLEHGDSRLRRGLRNPRLHGAALLAPCSLLLALLTGCATTRLDVVTSEGASVSFRFPKNLDAEGLVIEVGPHSLRAERLRTDAAAVIRAQGEATRGLAETAADALAP